jgi:hypothetical protein
MFYFLYLYCAVERRAWVQGWWGGGRGGLPVAACPCDAARACLGPPVRCAAPAPASRPSARLPGAPRMWWGGTTATLGTAAGCLASTWARRRPIKSTRYCCVLVLLPVLLPVLPPCVVVGVPGAGFLGAAHGSLLLAAPGAGFLGAAHGSLLLAAPVAGFPGAARGSLLLAAPGAALVRACLPTSQAPCAA